MPKCEVMLFGVPKAGNIATDHRIRGRFNYRFVELGPGRTFSYNWEFFGTGTRKKLIGATKTWRATIKNYALIVKPCKPNRRSNDALDDGATIGRSAQDGEFISITNAYVANEIFCKTNDHDALAGGYCGDSANRASSADNVTERWVDRIVLGQLADDCRPRATRQARAPKAGGVMAEFCGGNAPKNFSPLLPPCASWSNSGDSVVEQRQHC